QGARCGRWRCCCDLCYGLLRGVLASGGAVVALENSAESALANNLVGIRFLPESGPCGLPDRDVADPLMRAMLVEMGDELGEQVRQMLLAKNNEMVKALFTHRPDPALGEGILVRTGRRRADYLHAGTLHGLVEALGELTVAITDQVRGLTTH